MVIYATEYEKRLIVQALRDLCPELPRRGTESGRHAGSQS